MPSFPIARSSLQLAHSDRAPALYFHLSSFHYLKETQIQVQTLHIHLPPRLCTGVNTVRLSSDAQIWRGPDISQWNKRTNSSYERYHILTLRFGTINCHHFGMTEREHPHLHASDDIIDTQETAVGFSDANFRLCRDAPAAIVAVPGSCPRGVRVWHHLAFRLRTHRWGINDNCAFISDKRQRPGALAVMVSPFGDARLRRAQLQIVTLTFCAL